MRPMSFEGTSDVVNALEYSIHIHDIYVHEDDTNDSEHVLVESSMPVQVTRYSLVIPMIEDRIEHEIVANSVITFSKLSKSPHANCQTHTSRMRRSRFIF